MGAVKAPIFLSFEFMTSDPPAVYSLSVESTHPGVIHLGIDVKGLVLDVVVPLFELPVHILGLEDLADAGFKNQGVVDAGHLFCLQDGFKLHAAIRKMPYDRQRILLLSSFSSCAFIDDRQSPDFSWFA